MCHLTSFLCFQSYLSVWYSCVISSYISSLIASSVIPKQEYHLYWVSNFSPLFFFSRLDFFFKSFLFHYRFYTFLCYFFLIPSFIPSNSLGILIFYSVYLIIQNWQYVHLILQEIFASNCSLLLLLLLFTRVES